MRYIPYSRFERNELILRDHLALDRTILANERTFLAYIRTALALLITGIGMRELLDDDVFWAYVGLLFIVLSGIVFVIGSYKYIEKKGHLKHFNK